MIDLSGRVAVITGAGHPQGQGAATAKVMSGHGAAVVLADINGEGAAELAEALRQDGRDAVGINVDVRVEGDIERMIGTAIEEFGRLDILHNQAADVHYLADPGDPEITQMTLKGWHDQFETLVLGPMLGCKHGIPAMLRSDRGGSIICTSSISGMMGEPNLTVYAAAKAAVNQVVRSVSAQWGKEGIRANAVAPGLVLSEPGLALGEPLIAQYERHCDTPKVGQPIDSAHLVTFLASDEARYITGQVIEMDGGFRQHSPMLVEQRADGLMTETSESAA
jgi:NAD(P)-dependent dehydrogenase (short-subunit alcohol dehydrogenase family)